MAGSEGYLLFILHRAYNEQRKGPWDNGGAGTRVLGCRSRRRAELGIRQIQPARFGIECYGPGALLSGDVFQHVVGIR